MADANTLMYRLRPVEFKGIQTHVVCYHGAAVWPTAVAVVNYFLLTDPSCLKFDREVEFISFWVLRDMLLSLRDKVVMGMRKEQSKPWNESKEKEAMEDAQAALLELDDSSIQPINIFTSSFIDGSAISTLAQLNIPVVHGWILPNEDKYNKLRGKLAQDPTLELKDMEIARDFLENSPTELTQQGIKNLSKKGIDEGSLCALYRQYLNLIYKHEGNLYVLLTEWEIHDLPPSALWKSLAVGYDELVLFTQNFVPLPADEQLNEATKLRACRYFFIISNHASSD